MIAAVAHGAMLGAIAMTLFLTWVGEVGDDRLAVVSGFAVSAIAIVVVAALAAALPPGAEWVP